MGRRGWRSEVNRKSEIGRIDGGGFFWGGGKNLNRWLTGGHYGLRLAFRWVGTGFVRNYDGVGIVDFGE